MILVWSSVLDDRYIYPSCHALCSVHTKELHDHTGASAFDRARMLVAARCDEELCLKLETSGKRVYADVRDVRINHSNGGGPALMQQEASKAQLTECQHRR